ncbi:MAG: clpX [Candidatus Saganbacteria bacterium]|uniref:ClpX n=1 Tax=Candidatus Saganbacteria bacterium TaxID=2575572 RepID=A0A833L2T7_UNCSA|nr:MAG: clpX [Candidatus Saganbacteria bacterium]
MAGKIKTAAKIQKVSHEKYLEVLLGKNTHLYYHSFSVNSFLGIALPGEVIYPKIKKSWVMIESSSWEKNNDLKEYLLSLLNEKIAGEFGYNYLCVTDPALKCDKVHLIFMGIEPLSKIRDSAEIKKLAGAELQTDMALPAKLCPEISLLTPKEICAELDKMVLGQEEAKKSLSVILYQHLKRYSLSRKEIRLPKTNALLIGPTGCGKTLLARTMAEVVKLPFVRIDAVNFAQRGYRGGMHVEQIIDLYPFCGARQERNS